MPKPWMRDVSFLRFLVALLFLTATGEAMVIWWQQQEIHRARLRPVDLWASTILNELPREARLLAMAPDDLGFRLSDVVALQNDVDHWIDGFAQQRGLQDRTHQMLRAALTSHVTAYGHRRVEIAAGHTTSEDVELMQRASDLALERTVEGLVDPETAAAFLAELATRWPDWVQEHLGLER
jgi:hypothetical protein